MTALTEATRIAPAGGTAWLTMELAQQARGRQQAALLNAGLIERRLGRAAPSRRTLIEAARLDPVSDLG